MQTAERITMILLYSYKKQDQVAYLSFIRHCFLIVDMTEQSKL